MEQEIVPPKRTGKPATVIMQVQVAVQVLGSDSYADMTEQAREQLRKRILPAKTFHPLRAECLLIHEGIDVERLKYQTEVQPATAWERGKK